MNYGTLGQLHFFKLQFLSGIGHIVSHPLPVIPKVGMNITSSSEVCQVNRKSLLRHFFKYYSWNDSCLFYLVLIIISAAQAQAHLKSRIVIPNLVLALQNTECLWLSSVTFQISNTAFFFEGPDLLFYERWNNEAITEIDHLWNSFQKTTSKKNC